MKSCPGCNFLIDDDAVTCRLCGADATSVPAATGVDDEPASEVESGRETLSTKVTAGIIVAASVLVIGLGTWAFHPTSTPAPPKPARVATPTVRYQRVSVTQGGPPYHLEVAVGAAAPKVTSTVASQYATGRELDAARLPGIAGGGADLHSLVTTFAAGWPVSDVGSITAAAGAGLNFQLTNSTELIIGTLIDAGPNGVFLIDVTASPGSTLTTADRDALGHAVASLAAGP